MKHIILLALVILIGLTVWSVFFTVHETQHAIVTRFGDPLREFKDEPGLKVKWPWPIERVVFFDRRLLVLDMPSPGEPAREFLTMDKKNIEVSSYTCWKIEAPLRFLETVGTREDAEARLGDIVVSELGTVLGQHDLSALISIDPEDSTEPRKLKLDEMTERIRTTCAKLAAQEYGVEIVDFRIKRVNFPEQNRASVFERMRAERSRIATRYRSEGEEEATKIQADADKKRTEIVAKAYRTAKETEGRAEAEATRIYAAAYEQDSEFYEFLRTLESYEKSLTHKTTIILPADSPYLKLLSPDAAAIGSAFKTSRVVKERQPVSASTPRAAEKADE